MLPFYTDSISFKVSMITFPRQNYNIYSKQAVKPAFKGCTETTTLKSAGQNKDDMCIHETYFFRNIETLNFTVDYITKNFKNGTNIAEFASSTGEEAYSIAMLLKQNNADKKYKINAYDIVPRVIETMDTRLYEITSNNMENFLVSYRSLKTKEQNNLRNLFNECFEEFPRKLQSYNYNPKNNHKLRKRLASTKNEKEKTELKYMLSFSEIAPQYKWCNYFYPKKETFKDIVSFEVKDISDLGDKFNLEKNTGVVLFKNAFYHLMGFSTYSMAPEPDLGLASKVAKEINKSLDNNGILVIGALKRDHLYNNNCTRTIEQDGKKINIFDDSPFHKMLKKNGFEPIFYEQVRDCTGDLIVSGPSLPSVWKKVRTV